MQGKKGKKVEVFTPTRFAAVSLVTGSARAGASRCVRHFKHARHPKLALVAVYGSTRAGSDVVDVCTSIVRNILTSSSLNGAACVTDVNHPVAVVVSVSVGALALVAAIYSMTHATVVARVILA